MAMSREARVAAARKLVMMAQKLIELEAKSTLPPTADKSVESAIEELVQAFEKFEKGQRPKPIDVAILKSGQMLRDQIGQVLKIMHHKLHQGSWKHESKAPPAI